MKSNLLALCLVALAPGAALADRPGEHPAVVVQRLHAAAGYDYASKFYPHPAWLYLLPEEPRPATDDPARLLASTGKQGKVPVRESVIVPVSVTAEPVAHPSR